MANLTQDEREVLINSLALNCGSCDGDRPFLEGLSDKTLVTFAENALPPQFKKKKGAESADNEESEDDEMQEDGETDEEETPPPSQKKKAPAGVGGATQNSQNEEESIVQKQQTTEEWFAAAPPAVQSAVRNAMAIEAREKNTLVDKLTANVSDPERKKTLTANLLGKELSELSDLVSLMPAPAPASQPLTPLFFGASTPVGNSSGDVGFDKNDILPLPTLNYAEISKTA